MQITDDGVGFDPAKHRSGGLGLVSMRERLSLVGGQITIDSRNGGGTRIDVCVPLPHPVGETCELSARDPNGAAELVAAGSNTEESP
jgi:signal transduction histidine kinase